MVNIQIRPGRHRLDPAHQQTSPAIVQRRTPSTVPLGWLTPPSDAQQVRGRILLLANGFIAVPRYRLQTGWSCVVLASTDARPHPGRLTVPAPHIPAARTTVDVDPVARPEQYAAVWQALVYRSSPGGYLAVIARHLATTLRAAGTTLTVALAAADEHRLHAATGLRRAGLQRLLERLIDKEFLAGAAAADPSDLGTYHLTIPAAEGYEGAQP